MTPEQRARYEALMGNISADDKKIIKKAPFSWHGGKSRSASRIIRHLPVTDRYVEVFGGSGVVLLNKTQCKLDVFNDMYSGVTDFYICLQDENLMEKVKEYLRYMPNSRELFYFCQKTWLDTDEIALRAAKWYYMIVESFSSQGRHFGKSNVESKNRVLLHFPAFTEAHRRFKNVTIENKDWAELFADYDSPDTVFYCDPPYLETSGNQYTHAMNTETEHKQFLDHVFELKGFVAVSGYDAKLYEQYPWDTIETWEVLVSSKSCANHIDNGKNDVNYRKNRREFLYIKEAK